MKKYQTSSIGQIIDAIGASGPDPSAFGPEVVEITWENKTITGSYYKGKKYPDVISKEDVIFDDAALRPYVELLLSERKSFVTETGTHDMVCTLIWERKD